MEEIVLTFLGVIENSSKVLHSESMSSQGANPVGLVDVECEIFKVGGS